MNGYDEELPWPENMPKDLQKSAKRLDIYNKNPKLEVYLCLEQEHMEALAKTAEIEEKITENELDVILTKIGL